jgi:hypothetical protein
MYRKQRSTADPIVRLAGERVCGTVDPQLAAGA